MLLGVWLVALFGSVTWFFDESVSANFFGFPSEDWGQAERMAENPSSIDGGTEKHTFGEDVCIRGCQASGYFGVPHFKANLEHFNTSVLSKVEYSSMALK